eukprot:374413-Hanusia_phi.AAC.3
MEGKVQEEEDEDEDEVSDACAHLALMNVGLGDVADAPVEGDASSQTVQTYHDERVQAGER